jgi:hypothetical protein
MERYRQDAATAVEGIVATITTGVLVDRAGESGVSSTNCDGRSQMPNPHRFADRIDGQSRAFDPSSD